MKTIIKVIEVEDSYVDNTKKYPYTLSTESKIRLLLRTKKTFTYEPILLIDKGIYIESLLPCFEELSLESEYCQQNFQVYKGKFNEDGEWECDLENLKQGILNFQIGFVGYGKSMVKEWGTHDTVLIVQNNIDLKTLRLQTVFPRCVGKIQKWSQFIHEQTQLGYNSFHFAPIQETGSSKSYYSIYNQLELANDLFSGNSESKYEQLENFLKSFQKKGNIFFIDILLNHTSFDSDWIKENPDTVFTTENTPELNSAYILDKTIKEWGNEIKLTLQQTEIQLDEDQLLEIEKSLVSLVQNLNLEEYFHLPEEIKNKMLAILPTRKPSQNIFAPDPSDLILQFLHKNIINLGCYRHGLQIKGIETDWKKLDVAYEQENLVHAIRTYNNQWEKKIRNEWIPEIVKNIMSQIRNSYVDNRYRSFTDQYPFVQTYFTAVKRKNGQEFYALNNGWGYDVNTNENIVTSKNFYYLKRKIFAWGDLLRIRYGDSPLDSPSWEYVKKYVQLMAKHFDGFRLDNLHGTQMNVGEYMVKEARKIKPQIIIFAELFTRNDQQRAYFVRKLGINSTLKEMKYNLDGNSFIHMFHEKLGPKRRYMGSINPYFENERQQLIKYSERKQPIALLYDQTHDNSSYEEQKKYIVKTPMTLLTSLLGTFIGSTKGYDQFYSHKIDVTQTAPLYLKDTHPKIKIDKSEVEKRKIIYEGKQKVKLYGNWNDWKQGEEPCQSKDEMKQFQLELPPGKYEYKFKNESQWLTDKNKNVNSSKNHQFYVPAERTRKIYNNLQELRRKSITYKQRYQKMDEYFAYNDGQTIVMIREDCEHHEAVCVIANLSVTEQKITKPIELPGTYISSEVWHQTQYEMYQGFFTDVQILYHENIFEYFDISFNEKKQKDVLTCSHLPAGFSCLIHCRKKKITEEIIKSVNELCRIPIKLPDLGALDYNLLMFGVNSEELARFGQANYVLPKSGKQLIYGGFGGIYKEIMTAKKHNILSLELFDNLREGNWLLDYYIERTKRFKNLSIIVEILETYFNSFKELPNYLKPKYFVDFIYHLCQTIENNASKSKSKFIRKLSLASNQFFSSFNSQKLMYKVTLAAGLPHFSTGWSRSWGRDTFISNELLLLYPNIYKDIIIQFAAALRHGMIPNLLDSGNNPRYNCRDACWWFVRGVKEYANQTKDYSIFKTKVKMLFLSDDLLEHKQLMNKGKQKVMLVEEIIQAIFQTHADGISYREWHAGYEIDENMNSQGFDIKLLVDDETGFIVGGNSFNCLTWMDKMGSSAKANNKGYPATPRAGTPVELVGLLYHCLESYEKLYKNGQYSYEGITFKKRNITFKMWMERIHKNFQKQFYIQQTDRENKYTGIYCDVVNTSEHLFYEQNRLRPNALIALALSPSLFEPSHAQNYLNNVEKHLLFKSSIGVSTLGERHDSLYAPFYDNSDDSSHLRLAHGFSYHNGPEWVWLYGFYIVARCNFTKDLKKQQAMGLVQDHLKYIEKDEWMSLPELTDRNGEHNRFSCSSQAWSISSMLFAMQKINELA